MNNREKRSIYYLSFVIISVDKVSLDEVPLLEKNVSLFFFIQALNVLLLSISLSWIKSLNFCEPISSTQLTVCTTSSDISRIHAYQICFIAIKDERVA